MAEQQPIGVDEGASRVRPPSTGQDAPNGGAQQEETVHSDSDFFHSDSESDLFLSTELTKPPSGENGWFRSSLGYLIHQILCLLVCFTSIQSNNHTHDHEGIQLLVAFLGPPSKGLCLT